MSRTLMAQWLEKCDYCGKQSAEYDDESDQYICRYCGARWESEESDDSVHNLMKEYYPQTYQSNLGETMKEDLGWIALLIGLMVSIICVVIS